MGNVIVKIVSNNICFGHLPNIHDEVEQHLVIKSTGQVRLIGYNFIGGIDDKVEGRRVETKIDKKLAQKIISLISKYYLSDNIPNIVYDVGSWDLTIITENQEILKIYGSLVGGVCIDSINLTDYLRKSIGDIPNLFVFGDEI